MTLFRRGTFLFSAIVLALVVSGAWFLLDRWVGTPTGATRTIYHQPDFAGGIARQEVVPDIDLEFTREAHAPRRFFSARWSAVWYVERAGTYDLYLGADDAGGLLVDGELVLERSRQAGYPTVSIARELSAGLHTIQVDYEQQRGSWFLAAQWAPRGGQPRPFADAWLFPHPPTPEQIRTNTRLRWLRAAANASWLLVLALVLQHGVAAVRRTIAADARGWRGVAARVSSRTGSRLRVAWPWLAPLAAVLVVIAAAAIRFEVICVMYGPFERPSWLYEAEAHAREPIGRFRPDSFSIGPVDPAIRHGGDPINYLKMARGMTAFYAAHVREPIHLFTTKQWLALVEDQDVGISFNSASFSVLAVAATYLLGSYAFSRWVGLAAAFALAMERDIISWSADGGRDEATMAMFVLGGYAFLRCAREPTVVNAMVAGLIGGLAVLTRITTLSFLLPAIAIVLWRGLRRREHDPSRMAYWRTAAISLVVMAAVAAPYLINCAIVFGDPFYSINAHTVFYRARAGLAFDQPMSAGAYLAMRLQQHPWETVMTGVQGLTTYPFGIKWIGFDYWRHGVGAALMWLSVIGMAWGLWTRNGRFLAILLMASLLPYAFTWSIPGGGEWRFTMHAYPIYLIGSALAVERVAAWGLRRLGSSGVS